MENIKLKKVNDKAIVPSYANEFAAGADLYACVEEDTVIKAHETKLIPTGISMEIPNGYGGFIYARSGLASKKGLAPANKVGVVDSDYRGEIMVALHNHSNEDRIIEPSERVAQLVIAPFLRVSFNEVDELDETSRGSGAFGSTGNK
ncbi:MAG: dUTP diphosphatase [bacterium]